MREMGKKFVKYILDGQFDFAKSLCKDMDRNLIRDTIIICANDTENVTLLLFAQDMFKTTQDMFWLDVLIDLLLGPLAFYEGAYHAAYYYSRLALKIQNSIGNLERILFFYGLPERVMNYSHAKEYAELLLTMDKNNKTAKMILGLNASR